MLERVSDILRRMFPARVKFIKHPWRAIRMQGGGNLNSPFDMDESEACMWVANVIKGEIMFIDRECGFIFYRPKE